MINVVTVHWQSSDWIGPQLSYLEANLDRPFRVFASLNGIDDDQLWRRFHFAADLEGTHAEKLNQLARIAMAQSDPEDQLLFLDGDAFPVRPIGPWMEDALRSYPLVAVLRSENLGDRQPHPCFCFTTHRFWDVIEGDWREGGTWISAAGEPTTDVGGTLLHQLADRGIEWLPLLRTNTHNPNPLWFGVYDHRVYHHGAGFRPRISRVDHHAETEADKRLGPPPKGPGLERLAAKAVRRPTELTRLRPRHLTQVGAAAKRTVAKRRRTRIEQRRARDVERAERYEREVFHRLLSDPDFYREFDDTQG